jgi:hypothetical protein
MYQLAFLRESSICVLGASSIDTRRIAAHVLKQFVPILLTCTINALAVGATNYICMHISERSSNIARMAAGMIVLLLLKSKIKRLRLDE